MIEVRGAKARVDTQKRRQAIAKIMDLLGTDAASAVTTADLHAVLDDVAMTMCYEVLADGYYDGRLDRMELDPTGPGSGELAYWILKEPVQPRLREVSSRQRRPLRGDRVSRPSRRKAKPIGDFTLMDDGTVRLGLDQFMQIMQRLEQAE